VARPRRQVGQARKSMNPKFTPVIRGGTLWTTVLPNYRSLHQSSRRWRTTTHAFRTALTADVHHSYRSSHPGYLLMGHISLKNQALSASVISIGLMKLGNRTDQRGEGGPRTDPMAGLRDLRALRLPDRATPKSPVRTGLHPGKPVPERARSTETLQGSLR
jgi:hypothetical protein